MDTLSEYTIIYKDNLMASQMTRIGNNMINHFGGDCKPNRIMVGLKTTTIDTHSPCLTGERLKNISDMTLSPNPPDIKAINLNNKQIWPN